MKKLIVLIFCLFYSCLYANPSITGVTGTTTLTISGSSFGTKTTAAPIKFDNFEWGSVDDEINSSNDPVAPKWQKDTTFFATINTTKFHSGSQSAYQAIEVNSGDCGFYAAYIDITATKELYITYWTYWDTADSQAFSEAGAFFKFNRINSGGVPYSGYPNMLLNLFPNYDDPETGYMTMLNYVDDGNVFNDDRPPTALVIEHGGWHRIEMWMSLSDPAGYTNGELEYSIDSVAVEVTGKDVPFLGVTKATGSTNDIDIFTFLFDGCRFTETSYPLLWQDDVYVDNTRARVEVCNASTWAACTHREIQIPTAWATDEITVTANEGSFETIAGNYLYVIDSDGNVSDGFLIPSDIIPPTVTAFAIPSTYTSIPVPVTTFTATDDVGVTGYIVTASAVAPTYTESGWTPSPPTELDFLVEGANTGYAWAKDAAGNVSTSATDDCTVTLPEPGVTWEDQPTWSVTFEDQPTWRLIFGENMDIYISSVAADGGNGSISYPYNEFSDINWATVSTAVAADRQVSIFIKAGETYHEKFLVQASGSESKPIIITSYGTGSKPQLWGSEEITSWTKTAGRTNVYQFSKAGLDMDIIHIINDGSPYWHLWEDNITYGPIYLTAADDVADVDATAGSCWYDAINDIFYAHTTGSTNPATDGNTYYVPDIYMVFGLCDGTRRNYFNISNLDIQYAGRYPFATHDIAMSEISENFTIHDVDVNVTRHDGFVFTGENIIGYDLTVTNCKANGAFVINAEEADGTEQASITLTNCVYTDTNGDVTGQYANGAFHFHPGANNSHVIDGESHGTVAAPIWSSDEGVVEDCSVVGLTVTGNPLQYIKLNTENTNFLVSNYVASGKNTLHAAIELDDSTDAIINNSVFVGSDYANSIGIKVDGTNGLRVLNSEFSNYLGQAINVYLATQTDFVINGCLLRDNGYGFYTSVTTNKPTIKNCILSGNDYGIVASSGVSAAPISDYNCLYDQSGANFRVTSTNGSLAVWIGATGMDAHSTEGDPQLNTDGKIGTGSAAEDAGVVLTGINDDGELDRWGNAVDATPHIGMYQGSLVVE